jgi:hypothetical protein
LDFVLVIHKSIVNFNKGSLIDMGNMHYTQEEVDLPKEESEP